MSRLNWNLTSSKIWYFFRVRCNGYTAMSRFSDVSEIFSIPDVTVIPSWLGLLEWHFPHTRFHGYAAITRSSGMTFSPHHMSWIYHHDSVFWSEIFSTPDVMDIPSWLGLLEWHFPHTICHEYTIMTRSSGVKFSPRQMSLIYHHDSVFWSDIFPTPYVMDIPSWLGLLEWHFLHTSCHGFIAVISVVGVPIVRTECNASRLGWY